MKQHRRSDSLTVSTTLAQAAPIASANPAEVAALQHGLQAQTFESVSGRTPLTVDAFPSTTMVAGAEARVLDQVPVQPLSSRF